MLYVFNAKKLSDVNAAKSIMQKVFKGDNKDKIYDVIFPKIQGIFGWVGTKVDFLDEYFIEVDNINSQLYKFISIN